MNTTLSPREAIQRLYVVRELRDLWAAQWKAAVEAGDYAQANTFLALQRPVLVEEGALRAALRAECRTPLTVLMDSE